MAGPVGRAAAGGACQRRLRIGHPGQHHAVVQQRQHHRQQGALLAAVETGGGGEHTGRTADQRAGHPQVAALIEKILERRRHVAEAGRRAQCQTGTAGQIVQSGVGGAAVRHRRGAGLVIRRHRRHGAQARLQAGAFHAARHLLRQPRHAAGAAVIKDQHIGVEGRVAHGVTSSRTVSGGRPITARSPFTSTGRSSSLG